MASFLENNKEIKYQKLKNELKFLNEFSKKIQRYEKHNNIEQVIYY